MKLDTFSKNDTSVIKGVAILFMVFAHLFNNMYLCGLSQPLFFIEKEPLIHYMIFGMNPVDFFIILSGYGLYVSYRNGKKNNGKRVLSLYIHYWISLAIFVPLGFFINGGGQYPGDLLNCILNMIGWVNSYNHETWFLLPYSILALIAPLLFFYTEKIKSLLVFSISFVVYIAVRFASRYDGELIENFYLLRWLDSLLTLQFPFLLGMLLAKCWNYSKVKAKVQKANIFLGIFLLAIYVGIIALRNHFQSIAYPFYVLSFISTFVLLDKPLWLTKFLKEMGKRSTSIWLIHTYFCYYLFQEFIYSFKYPVLIYIVLLIISYLTAIIVDKINIVVTKRVFK